MRIFHYYDPADLLVLRAANEYVAKVEDISSYLDTMFTLMHKARGVGLASPQIGLNKRFFIVEIDEGKRHVFVNPEIVETSIEMVTHEEGCLSFAGLYEKVRRPAYVKMQAQNERGRNFVIEAEGFMAVCLQHEFDHLNGKLFIDHLDEKHQANALKRYSKIAEKYKLKAR
jgi:peptide deformylase